MQTGHARRRLISKKKAVRVRVPTNGRADGGLRMSIASFTPPHRVSVLTLFAGLLFGFVQASMAAPPTISGTPSTKVRVGQWYSFRPHVSDPDTPRRGLRFSIVNKPAWAQFSTHSGRLSGKPPQAGTWSNIRITVSDGRSTASLRPFSIVAVNGGSTSPATSSGNSSSGNRAPTISGTPPTAAVVGSTYSFRPTARDPDSDTLTFNITNRPAWATFDTTTGRLSGTPSRSHIGTYSNIVIRVSDGRTTTSLPAFSITVSDVGSGAATVTWVPPTRNRDGSALNDLAGYRILYGTSANALDRSVMVRNPGISSYVVDNLAPGTYYFAVRAVNTAGVESANSNTASKTIR